MSPSHARSGSAVVIAVVVTHRPDPNLLTEQTQALRSQVDRLIWVDNGSGEAVAELAHGLAVECMALPQNVGIAQAQNLGVERALSSGASHVLLMDHDSIPAPDMVRQLLLGLRRCPDAAAAGPWYQDPRGQEHPPFVQIRGCRTLRLAQPAGHVDDGEAIEVDHLIASGCLIRREAWLSVGPMTSELFIDFVDVEWCLRARSLGWTVVGVWNARMSHHLGHSVRTLWGRRFHVHAPTRHYFHTRNAVFLWCQSWIPLGRRWATGYRLLLKCGFYLLVMDNRMSYLAATLRGCWHGLNLSIPSTHDPRERPHRPEPDR